MQAPQEQEYIFMGSIKLYLFRKMPLRVACVLDQPISRGTNRQTNQNSDKSLDLKKQTLSLGLFAFAAF